MLPEEPTPKSVGGRVAAIGDGLGGDSIAGRLVPAVTDALIRTSARNGVGRAGLPHRDPEPNSSENSNGVRAPNADSRYSQTTPSPSASFMYG